MFIYKFIWIISTPIIWLLWLRKVSGVKNVPQRGPVIIAANHQSWIDFFFLTATLPSRQLHFLIAGHLFTKKQFEWALKRMKHIKVDRQQTNKKEVYEKAAEILREGGALVLFPEGRLSRDGYTQKGFRGVAKIALDNQVDIVPVAIKNSFEVYPLHRSRPHIGRDKRCVEVKYLAKIKHSLFKDKTHEEIVHQMIMKKIADELGHEYNHQGFEKDTK